MGVRARRFSREGGTWLRGCVHRAGGRHVRTERKNCGRRAFGRLLQGIPSENRRAHVGAGLVAGKGGYEVWVVDRPRVRDWTGDEVYDDDEVVCRERE